MALPTRTFQNSQAVQRFANALYDYQIGTETMEYVFSDIAYYGDINDVFNAYYAATPGFSDAAAVADAMVENLGIIDGENGLDAADVTAAKDIVEATILANPASEGQALAALLAQYAAIPTNDPTSVYAAAATAWNAEIDTAMAYTGAEDVEVGSGEAGEGLTYWLEVDRDVLDGTSGSDTFNADVVQNMWGQQVNTLGTGDRLNGGAGNDTLDAQVTEGSFVGGGNMPIQPVVNNVENIFFQALNSNIGDTHALVTEVYVNAKNVDGVQNIGSVRSDADLTIQDLNTKGVNNLADMTIHMEYTSNADSKWDASNLNVYFDQDYLTPNTDQLARTVTFELLNEDAFTNGLPELSGVVVDTLAVKLNTQRVDFAIALREAGLEAGADVATGNEITTWAQLVSALNSDAVRDLMVAEYPALEGYEFSLGGTFEADEDRFGTEIILTIKGSVIVGGQEIINTIETNDDLAYINPAKQATGENSNRWDRAENGSGGQESSTSINVALEKVGLAGDGGELVIGSMNKTSANEWGAVNTTVDGTTSGIDEFNVTVYGDAAKSSSLAGLHSTNNNLRVVNVVTDSEQVDSFANLTIGNSNTEMGTFTGYENALKDVQTFDASAFLGDLTLYAALTDEITDKYLDLQDVQDNPAADNVNFEYTGGIGDDDINVTISADNDAFTGAVTREDFTMTSTIAGGDGDDAITLAIIGNSNNSDFDLQDGNGLAYASFGPFSTEDSLANWYDNQKLMANLRIDGGAGDDVIWTPGSGDVTIDAGSGADTVYADNTGDMAVWAFNVAQNADPVRLQLDNLQSDANDSYRLFKANLTVDFLGFESTVVIPSTNALSSDLQINQALKDAINNDAVLSKLIVAADGPGNTLVVTSLIDGQMVADDLSVEITAPTALTTAEVSTVSSAWGLTGQTASDLIDLMDDDQIVLFVDKGDYDSQFALDGGVIDGSDSLHTSDNTITGDTGNDVLVLGTGRLSNDTVVYEGYGNGTDTIVNFMTAEVIEGTPTFENLAEVIAFSDGAAEVTVDPAVATFTLDVTGSVATGAGTITFADAVFGDGGGVGLDIVVNVAGGETATDIALLIEAAFTAYTGEQFTALAVGETVEFTQVAAGTITEPTLGNVGTEDIDYNLSGVGLTLEDFVDGTAGGTTPATNATFTVDFSDADQAASYTFDGVTVDVLEDETGENIAASFAAADGDFANWTVTGYAPGATTVTFTAITAGSVTVVTDESFVGANIEIPGVDTLDFDASDYLDFSDYDAVAVYVDGDLVAGVAPAAGEGSINMVESATNAGEYSISDDLALIGTVDFGATQDFVAENFILA